MADMKMPVSLTNSNMEKISRHDLLKWVNSTVDGQYKKIEEMCSGVAYCQMMEQLFPLSVGVKKIKVNAKFEHEYLHNLKLFQAAFARINYEKSVPMERLVKGRFQDNFEFLQWFKKFHDVHSLCKANIKAPLQVDKNTDRHDNKMSHRPARKQTPTMESQKTNGHAAKMRTPENNQEPTQLMRPVSPNSLCVLQETMHELEQQMVTVQHDLDYYFRKVTAIEKLLKDSVESNTDVDWCQYVLNVLYATDTDVKVATAEL